MWQVQKSGLFKRQLLSFAKNYKDRASIEVAENFLDATEAAIAFIAHKPLACALYLGAKNHKTLKDIEFRKWPLSGFPHTIYFRIEGDNVIKLEAIYAHRMDTENKFPSELEQ